MPRSENYSTDSVQSFKSNFREHLTRAGSAVENCTMLPGFWSSLTLKNDVMPVAPQRINDPLEWSLRIGFAHGLGGPLLTILKLANFRVDEQARMRLATRRFGKFFSLTLLDTASSRICSHAFSIDGDFAALNNWAAG